MGVALYRKYRSSNIGDILGQDHIVTVVNNMVKNDTVPHAFLLTGPRGVGKTSIARLMAVMINKIDYKDLDRHLDIIEIDAASNRRIDEIRDLREEVNILPSSLRYKVYIIDEVHMLTKEAFNALLKTLEEPPEHVIFILATTELHKLPATIISRCIRFNFKHIENDLIQQHLLAICKKESLNIDNEAIALIAKHSGGSFRDAISILENFRYLGHAISPKDVQEYLGLPGEELVSGIINATAKSDFNNLQKHLAEVRNLGVNYATLAADLSNSLRLQILNNSLLISKNKIIILLDDLLDVQSAKYPDQKLLISLLKATDDNMYQAQIAPAIDAQKEKSDIAPHKKDTKDKAVAELHESAADDSKGHKHNVGTETDEKNKDDKKELLSIKMPDDVGDNDDTAVNTFGQEENFPDPSTVWRSILQILKEKHSTLYSIAKTGSVESFQHGRLVVVVTFPFHAKRLNEDKNKRIIAEYLATSIKEFSELSFITKPKENHAEHISSISNIFGAVEVLE